MRSEEFYWIQRFHQMKLQLQAQLTVESMMIQISNGLGNQVIILVKVMPAQFKHGQRRHHSSSSSSSPRHRDRDSKNHKHQKWHKRSRSRSRSNPKHDHRHKTFYQPHHKENYKFVPKPHENGRDNDYRKDHDFRRRAPSEEKRERPDDRKHIGGRFTYQKPQKDRERTQYRRDQRRDNSSEHNKRWQSSPSESKSASPRNHRPSPKHHHDKPPHPKREEKRQTKDVHIRDNEPSNYKTNRPQLNLQRQIKNLTTIDKDLERSRNVQLQSRQAIENSAVSRPKMIMKMPIPPPPPPPPPHSRRYPDNEPSKDNRQATREDYRRENKKDHHRMEDRFLKDEPAIHREQKDQRKEEKRQEYHAKPSIQTIRHQHERQRLSPIKRSYQQRRDNKLQTCQPEVEKAKVSKFEMILNQARMNLTFPSPPLSFMALETFRNMNKFEIETLDPRWSSQLRKELQKVPELRDYLQSVPREVESSSPRLWTYLKQQRNEEEQDLKLRIEQLKLHTATIAELTRKLKVIE